MANEPPSISSEIDWDNVCPECGCERGSIGGEGICECECHA
jgi:hypothetical protein